MKDAELREMLASLERKIEAATATMIGGDPKEVIQRLSRIQEVVEAGRRFGETHDVERRLESIKVLPWPLVGMLIGALLFAVGMLLGWLLLK